MAVLLTWALALLFAVGVVATAPSIRYIRFSRVGTIYLGAQEVQVFDTAGTNVAAGCGVTASGGMYIGSPSMAVNGAWKYDNFPGDDMLINIMPNPWFELDLGVPSTALTMLKLYVNNAGVAGDLNFYPGDTLTFMDGGRNIVATSVLPASWGGASTMPYVVPLSMLSIWASFSTSLYSALSNAALAGTPFAISRGTTPAESNCAFLCYATPLCTGYMWSSPGIIASNPCSLFSNVTSYRTDEHSNSGVLLSAPTPTLFTNSSFRSLPNTDLAGSPFATVFGVTSTEYSCAFYCSYTPPCTGYTWSSPTLFVNNPCCAYCGCGMPLHAQRSLV